MIARGVGRGWDPWRAVDIGVGAFCGALFASHRAGKAFLVACVVVVLWLSVAEFYRWTDGLLRRRLDRRQP